MLKEKYSNRINLIDKNMKIYWVLCAVGFLFILWRIRFGYCFHDEALNITFAQRLNNGEGFITGEWQGAMNFGSIVLPFYKLFHLFKGDTNDGIMLFFRYIYAFSWAATCTYVGYFQIKQFESVISGSATYLYLLLFSPLEQMTFSYTSVGLMCALLLSCLFVNVYRKEVKSSIFDIFIFSALSIVFVLCSPFMAIGFILFVVALNIACVIRKDTHLYNIRRMVNWSLPIIAVIALIYVYAFIISKADINLIVECVPYLLKDPEHSSSFKLWWVMYTMNLAFVLYTKDYCFIILLAALFLIFRKKLKINIKSEYVLLVCTIFYLIHQLILVRHIKNNSFMNFQVLFVSMLGVIVYLCLDKKPRLLFNVFFGVGVVYSFFLFMASNTGLSAISMTSTVFGCVAIPMIIEKIKELNESNIDNKLIKSLPVILMCVILLQISSQCLVKVLRQYWDKPLYKLTERIDEGACKGLYTCTENKDMYISRLNNEKTLLSNIDKNGKKFMSLTASPIIYVDANMEFGTFSAWSFSYGDKLADRFNEYYELTGNRPDVIFSANKEDIIDELVEGLSESEYNGAYLYAK